MRQTLSAETLHQIDGGIAGRLIDLEIARAVADLDDRGFEDGKTRKVAIELELALVDGMILTKVHVQAKLPPRTSHATAARSRREGSKMTLLFQDVPQTHPDQNTFEDVLPGADTGIEE